MVNGSFTGSTTFLVCGPYTDRVKLLMIVRLIVPSILSARKVFISKVASFQIYRNLVLELMMPSYMEVADVLYLTVPSGCTVTTVSILDLEEM